MNNIMNVQTDLGVLSVEWSKRGITRIGLSPRRGAAANGTASLVRRLAGALQRYSRGKSVRWPEPLDLTGGTAFQRRVWQALRTIPFGETRSYGWVAKRIGRPRAARAVGAACGANPIPIVIPCHRVVASDGSLGGYRGGLGWKKRLLKLEAKRSLSIRL